MRLEGAGGGPTTRVCIVALCALRGVLYTRDVRARFAISVQNAAVHLTFLTNYGYLQRQPVRPGELLRWEVTAAGRQLLADLAPKMRAEVDIIICPGATPPPQQSSAPLRRGWKLGANEVVPPLPSVPAPVTTTRVVPTGDATMSATAMVTPAAGVPYESRFRPSADWQPPADGFSGVGIGRDISTGQPWR